MNPPAPSEVLARLQAIAADPVERAAFQRDPRAVLTPLLGADRVGAVTDAELAPLAERLLAAASEDAGALSEADLAQVAGGAGGGFLDGVSSFFSGFFDSLSAGKGLVHAISEGERQARAKVGGEPRPRGFLA